jgi:hypothetical protein
LQGSKFAQLDASSICRAKAIYQFTPLLPLLRKKIGYSEFFGTLVFVTLFLHVFDHFRTSSRANIQLSGKKKQKILKQLRRSEKEKSEMEGETEKEGNSQSQESDSEIYFITLVNANLWNQLA